MSVSTTADLLAQGQRYYLPVYRPREVILERGQGARVWDSEGREYLDLSAGIAVCGLGHNDPDLVAALTEQAGKLWSTVTGESLKDSVAPGTHTTSWLTLQRAGTAASANPQAASAVQREKAADRFLKTYDFPIKESFYGDSFKSGSN